jgi:gluconate 2-dehydrogenase subunit 3-like protein
MKRRTALEVLGAGVAAGQLGIAQHHLVALVQAPESYKPRFFNPAQVELLTQLSEMIIPADAHSPGAREAKASLFMDLMISHSDKDVQEFWNSGLKFVEAEAEKRFRRSFLECGPSQQDEILTAMAAGEADPKTPLQQFFVRLKLMTIDGYYTSQIGIHRELQYKGNAVLAEFPGCRHTDH